MNFPYERYGTKQHKEKEKPKQMTALEERFYDTMTRTMNSIANSLDNINKSLALLNDNIEKNVIKNDVEKENIEEEREME